MYNIDRLISGQIHDWARSMIKPGRAEEPAEAWPVITISREYGARGRSLAMELGKRIGFKVWDKELLTAIAEEAGADERFLASLDERRRKMIEDTLYSSFMGYKHSNSHYFRSLLRVVKTIAAHGSSIIVGRGSHYIIKPQNALRVRIVSPVDIRTSYIAGQEDISVRNAQKLIRARETERSNFIRHYFKRDIRNIHDYDLVLNGEAFDICQLADMVLLAYEKKVGKTVPRFDPEYPD